MTLAANTSSKPDQKIVDPAIVPGLGVPVLTAADMAATARDNDLHLS